MKSSYPLLISLCLFAALSTITVKAQSVSTGSTYKLNYINVGKDTSFAAVVSSLLSTVSGQVEAANYARKIPTLLQARGYAAASVDSVGFSETAAVIYLYLGIKYDRFLLDVSQVEPAALEAIAFRASDYNGKPIDEAKLSNLKNRLLGYYEDYGFPFAQVLLDSVRLNGNSIAAILKVDKGVAYVIDSIRVYGGARVNKFFLQQHLGIKNGSIYSRKKLQDVDARMLQLPYFTNLQASDITLLGTGSVLNLYLQDKKSSQVNFLIGFLPAATPGGKLQITGDVNLDLKNLLGGGENFLLKWQSLQPRSPRLNIGYEQPYIFRSPFTVNFLFDLFKKDSNFLQVNALAGVAFALKQKQTGKLFLQVQNNSLLQGAIDSNSIKQSKQLPVNVDVSSVNTGITYEWLTTNYKFNPRRGNDVTATGTVGVKKIKRNNDILNIKDPTFNYAGLYDSVRLKSYQLRLKFTGAHFFPVAKRAAIKLGFNAGWYSSPQVFRNELFQIGGFKLLRGFNEESIYASTYSTGTVEYRYLTGLNSYLFGFSDYGFVVNKFQQINTKNNFISAGIGLVNETKFGIINLSVAAGKRNDLPFNAKEAVKLHFGYINYF